MSPEYIYRQIQRVFQETAEFITEAPSQIQEITEMIRFGELQLKLRHENLERLSSKIDIASNRLAVSILASSLIIGLSLIIQIGQPTILAKIPLAELGFIIAGVLGLMLVISIVRSGRF